MDTNKITDGLMGLLKKAQPGNEIEVVIELSSNAQHPELKKLSRTEKIASLKKAFNIELEPIVNEISNHGGNIIDSAWINKTVNAKVSFKCIEDLSQLKEVTAIDLPNQLLKD